MEAGTKPQDEQKFIVFYSSLLALFSVFCFKCKGEKPKVNMYQTGTMVTVEQQCSSCQGVKPFKWRSQPSLLGRAAGNILLSFSSLMAGASISKVLLVFQHFGLVVYSPRTYYRHQSEMIIPSILIYWEIQSLRNVQNAVWSGDGRFDSMGHSAKYGVYTMFCCTIIKIVHFDLLQVIICEIFYMLCSLSCFV